MNTQRMMLLEIVASLYDRLEDIERRLEALEERGEEQ